MEAAKVSVMSVAVSVCFGSKVKQSKDEDGPPDSGVGTCAPRALPVSDVVFVFESRRPNDVHGECVFIWRNVFLSPILSHVFACGKATQVNG